jgi:oxygen-independent coproporphyrinogen-3 oxidase
MLRALGINRISIGAQSFNDCDLAILGRNHRSSDNLTAINLLRASGFENISIDLIYGIPMQTLHGWRKSIVKATELSLPHISAYELTPAMNTKLYDLIKANQIALPDEQSILDMYHYTIERLTDSRFQHYEISNFAIPGFRCAHNLNYWDRGQYTGIGAGAHSFLSGIRSKNTDNIRSYITRITNGTIPQSESAELNKFEHIKEHIFLGLRKREGLNVRGINLSDYPVVEACSEFFDSGFMEMDEGSVRLTGKGLPVANSIIVRILEKLDPG